MECKKTIPKGYILYDFIFMIFLKWQNYENVKQNNGCQEFDREKRGKEMPVAIKGQHEESLRRQKRSVSRLHQCQHANWDIVLWFCRRLSLV